VKRSGPGKLLLDWYRRGHRELPWRASSDPYRIWVSEIMLQQTRAQAVIPYYERFLARFPTVEALAAAREDEVLALWAGLGYYSRARNLRKAAQAAVAAGGFPRDYEAIRSLPGVGDYTAAAIASIAFGLPHAVLDGNVLRVVARVENDAADIASSRTKERFRAVAQSWLDPREAGHFNQALMELGATVCLPKNPLCLVCPLRDCCRARQEGTAAQLPVKLRKTKPV
jgi:A/G-specific adenine glycosylase